MTALVNTATSRQRVTAAHKHLIHANQWFGEAHAVRNLRLAKPIAEANAAFYAQLAWEAMGGDGQLIPEREEPRQACRP